MEKDLEDHVKEAEEEGNYPKLILQYFCFVKQYELTAFSLPLSVKQLVIKGYLSIYNIMQGIAFFYITLAILIKLLLNRSGGFNNLHFLQQFSLCDCRERIRQCSQHLIE